MTAIRKCTRPDTATAVARSLAAPDPQKSVQLKIEYRAPGELKPADRAVHIYNRRQRRAVNASI